MNFQTLSDRERTRAADKWEGRRVLGHDAGNRDHFKVEKGESQGIF